MKAIEPLGEGALVVYAANQPEYDPLPARRLPDGTLRTRWQPDAIERRAILDGACIELEILTFGNPLQPVRLAVEGTEGQLVELPPP